MLNLILAKTSGMSVNNMQSSEILNARIYCALISICMLGASAVVLYAGSDESSLAWNIAALLLLTLGVAYLLIAVFLPPNSVRKAVMYTGNYWVIVPLAILAGVIAKIVSKKTDAED